jgi:hypothetical protein
MSHIPFGYRIVNGKAVVDDVAAEQIKALFQMRISALWLCPKKLKS